MAAIGTLKAKMTENGTRSSVEPLDGCKEAGVACVGSKPFADAREPCSPLMRGQDTAMRRAAGTFHEHARTTPNDSTGDHWLMGGHGPLNDAPDPLDSIQAAFGS